MKVVSVLGLFLCVLSCLGSCFGRNGKGGVRLCELKVRLDPKKSSETSHMVILWNRPFVSTNSQQRHWNYTMQYRISSDWENAVECLGTNRTTCNFHLRNFLASYDVRVKACCDGCKWSCTSEKIAVVPLYLDLMPAPKFDLMQFNDELIVRHHSLPHGVRKLGESLKISYQVEPNASNDRNSINDTQFALPIQHCNKTPDESMSTCCVRVRLHIPGLTRYILGTGQWSEWHCIDVNETQNPRHSIEWIILGVAIGFVATAIGGFLLYRAYLFGRDYMKIVSKIPESLEKALGDDGHEGLSISRQELKWDEAYESLSGATSRSCEIGETSFSNNNTTCSEWFDTDSEHGLLDSNRAQSGTISREHNRMEFTARDDSAYVTMTTVGACLKPRSRANRFPSNQSGDGYPSSSLSSPDDWLPSEPENIVLPIYGLSPGNGSTFSRNDLIVEQQAQSSQSRAQLDSGLCFLNSISSVESLSSGFNVGLSSTRDQSSECCVPPESQIADISSRVAAELYEPCDNLHCQCTCHDSSSSNRQFCTPNFSYISSEMAALGVGLK